MTGPLREGGYIDYVAALNERMKQGVTPENNAMVLLVRALGPVSQVAVNSLTATSKGRDARHRQSGGKYFRDFNRFLKDSQKPDH